MSPSTSGLTIFSRRRPQHPKHAAQAVKSIYCDNFLSELIHLEGQGHLSDVCGGCGTLDPCFWCEDCFGIQLGHCAGDRCYRPYPVARDDFMIIHSNGVHSVSLDFCGCESAEAPFQQLLCICWFLASSKKPCTAATFIVLQQFHLLSFKSKVSAFEFYQSLSHISDNTGLNQPKDWYKQFLHIIHQWCHLKLLKHTGHGHDPLGISNTKKGDCALLFPACPHPGKNLPQVSKDSNDPSLSKGWAYFVEGSTYKLYLSHHANGIQEKSMCSIHSAINMADTKGNQSLNSTGIGIVVCARHGMKLANGVRDLQKGERYVNMDYLFALALSSTAVNRLNVSYDIAWQWHKSLYQRMMSLPQEHVSFFVPKFHLPAHITPCQWKYSFNWMHGVGHTDGEVPECGWAHINPVGLSTKVMGPGHHCDTIDDFFSNWNWKKTIALGGCIISKVILQWNEHQEDFKELEASLSIKYPEQLSMWQQQVEDWEDDPSEPNPFEVKEICIILPSILISASVDLEDQQQHLWSDLTKLGMHATDAQKAKMQQHSNALAHHIEVWTKIHTLYFPGCGRASAPEDIPFYLPLQINHKFSSGHNLELIEFQLWEGQANDALNELSYMLKFKDCFLCGQGANTHAHNCLKNVDAKIDSSVAKYCAAHHALCTLGFLLADDDIHSMSSEDDQASEGSWQLSWIWLACGYMTENADDESDCGLQEAIQIEWCKARARAHHWAEELDLLLEEKWQTLQFLEWDATHWAERAKAVTGWEKSLDEGL
ncbi:hypothetical protein EDC04DRAFT_2868514 [Pisolithus marmoratus]|nr:hypothetical protein EDC04DRAFT_2868514 [Pisolithus marmoratus]